ncbi:MAG: histidine phosphatase family protein [Anaerolineae bacterium]|nr:histidine phosphatase family protein [Anaerolineae bacterium]
MSNVPRSVWLVRHGQTDWNHQRRYLSDADRGLTDYGRLQVQALARFFASRKVDVIVHSGLVRTEATALAIRGARDVPIVRDERWREVSHGAWEGLTYREVLRRYPEDAARRFADPVNHAPLHGESLAHMAERVRQAWDDLGAQFAGRRVVVATHSGPIQAVLCMLMGAPLAEHWRWRIDLGSLTALDCYPTATILRMTNYLPPIAPSLSRFPTHL